MADGAGFQYPTNFLVMGTQPYRIDAAQYAELLAYRDADDRTGFYIALNKMTGSVAALDMAEISSSSNIRGGVAWALNTAYEDADHNNGSRDTSDRTPQGNLRVFERMMLSEVSLETLIVSQEVQAARVTTRNGARVNIRLEHYLRRPILRFPLKQGDGTT